MEIYSLLEINWPLVKCRWCNRPQVCALQVMHPMQSKLRTIVGRQDLRAVHSKDSLKQSVLLVLDSLCGMAEAARVDSASLLFNLLCPAAADAVTLLGKWQAVLVFASHIHLTADNGIWFCCGVEAASIY